MNRNNTKWLILIVVLIGLALWVDLSSNISISNPSTGEPFFSRNVSIRLGLDLRGGQQSLLEADVPADVAVSSDDMKVTVQTLESRVNALGVSEVVMQIAGDRRIVAEFPGISNPEEVQAALQQTAFLEFVDMGDTPAAVGTTVQTDYVPGGVQPTVPPTLTPTLPPTITPTDTPATTPTDTPPTDGTTPPTDIIYHTVMTGAELDTVGVVNDPTQGYQISFTLKSIGTQAFSDYTSANVGKYLAIVLDKRVISTPVINSAITDGQGVIQGNFTYDSANALAIQLRYGSLPIPVKVVESRTVGPTLGEESVRKSVLAGTIGLSVVILFMLLYYRVPGLLAALALITYALFTLALFKIIPVVLTLPGIAGFILSIGMAVDANILIFERMKEELRSGRNLRQAIELGWSRAWPSIRDSNISTLITSFILFLFGNTFGASMVKGFSITLALGVIVSLFTAINVTRTYLHVVLDNTKLEEHPGWFGL
ncbi:MAG: protein-export membrane protein SecD [Chloroflexi bacterium RIFOXYC12_FULL_59_14]|nr:MAG: protein-export membrane protein SecD [Chloroflexi bacterium RIFOXYD12_FULL_57_15]OGO75182.1 MAG: protein-export membrane protein SecD [Chloroflexi bacterium RIFOXYC12_FULL_59_14]